MTDIADEYEKRFHEGFRDLARFLREHDPSPEEIGDIVLADQYLRQQISESIPVHQYVRDLPFVADDTSLQIELWCEALGYVEEKGAMTPSTRSALLEDVPEAIRGEVSQAVGISRDSTAASDQAPELDRYRIDQEIGRGAFGVVYRAWDLQLQRNVAIKVIHGLATDETLFDEARIVAKLDDPGIVSVFDCGVDPLGRTFIVTSLLHGESLTDWCEVAGGDQQRVVRLFVDLCDALSTAHAAGIVHRDLKPSNIIVRTGDRPSILDFGLALAQWNPGRSGELVGTPAYMSPEQARGEGHRVDARSDVFSIGILLIESLAKQRPWRSQTSRELLDEVSTGKLIPLGRLAPEILIELQRICSKATAAAMSDRYDSAASLADDLRWYLSRPQLDETAVSNRNLHRGLRPFTSADAAEFWTLLPGQRDARGMPDSVRWWLDRLQPSDPTASQRPVLVLYGPSGSGKSSLLHAGVLPHIHPQIEITCVDVTELSGVDGLAAELKRRCEIDEPPSTDFPETCRLLRTDERTKQIVVMDQFEQAFGWSESESLSDELVRGLRQADSLRLQFVLVVRDEFWSATSRLMHAIDQPLRDQRNAFGAEPFGRSHAASVLQSWSRATLDPRLIENAVDLVAEDGRVIAVRLALLATLLGPDQWSEQRLDQLRQRGSLGQVFLSDSVDRPTQYQDLAPSARKCLRRLVPAKGKLRGVPVPESELREAVGLQVSDPKFHDMLDRLDRQLHLLTPTATDAGETSYQLTHDYWVPEVRNWLRIHDRSTAKGRATTDLAERSQRWHANPIPSQLAGPVDCLRFGVLTNPINEEQRVFVRASAIRQLKANTVIVAAMTMLAAFFWWTVKSLEATAIVERVATSSTDRLEINIADARQHLRWVRHPLVQTLQQSELNHDLPAKDRLALTLLESEPDHAQYLSQRLLEVDQELRKAIVDHFREDLRDADRNAVVASLASVLGAQDNSRRTRLRAAMALASLAPEHPYWQQHAESTCRMLVESDPLELGEFAQGLFPIRMQLIPELSTMRAAGDITGARTATFLLARFATDNPDALVDLLEHTSLSQLSVVVPAILPATDVVVVPIQKRYSELLRDWDAMSLSEEVDNAQDNRAFSPSRGSAVRNRRVQLANRLGNLAAVLLAMGVSDDVEKQLCRAEDPTLRSYIIECYTRAALPANPIAKQLAASFNAASATQQSDNSHETGIAAAYLQILGRLPPSSQVPPSAQELARDCLRHPFDSELAASAEFFLRRGGFDIDYSHLPRFDAIDNETNTYVTIENQVMVRLPGGVRTTVGSSLTDVGRLPNEAMHEIDIPVGLFFSRHELTTAQLMRFRDDLGIQMMNADGGNQVKSAKNAQTMRIGFYEAATYCNWLSEREGIPKSEWCYEPNERGTLNGGMRIVEDHLRRRGYQIPTPDLWEYACRSGTRTPRPYGFGMELSSGSIRWMGARSSSRPATPARLPNAFGLFDMLGNHAEWTIGLVAQNQGGFSFGAASGGPPFGPGAGSPRRRPRNSGGTPGAKRNGNPGIGRGGGPILESAAGATIRDNNHFAILGGAFDSPAHKVRSSDRSIISPPITNKPITLRLMRVIPK